MNPRLVFAKTPAGDDALRQGTRLVQRNLRMVLLQVDGQLTVSELSTKIGNAQLVESALLELEESGFIVATLEANSFASQDFDTRETFAVSGNAAAASSHALSGFSSFDPVSLIPEEGEEKLDSVTTEAFPDTQVLSEKKVESPVQQVAETEASEQSQQSSGGVLKKLFLGVLVILLLVAGGVFFYPYNNYRPIIEKHLTEFFGVDVHVGKVAVTFFPESRLRIQGVKIGDDSSIDEIQLPSPLALRNVKTAFLVLPVVEVKNAKFSVERLLHAPGLARDEEVEQALRIGRLRIDRLRIDLNSELHLSELNADFVFDVAGNFEKALLTADGKKLKLNVERVGTMFGIDVEGRDWKPDGIPMTFGLLQTRAILQEKRLTLENFDTSLLGGLLKGRWVFDWANGLNLSAELSATRLDSRKMSAAFFPNTRLEGDLSAAGKLRSQAKEWDQLWQELEAQFDVDIGPGIFYGADPIEAARRGDLETRAGSTRFQRIRASVSLNPKQLALRNLQLDSGAVNGVGQFVVTRAGQVEGQLDVTVQTSVSSQRTPIRIYGVLPELTAVSRR